MADQCASLPSSSAAYNLVHRGDLKDWGSAIGTTVLRAGLIGVGLYLYDNDDPKIPQKALVSSLMIEAFVLSYIFLNTRK